MPGTRQRAALGKSPLCRVQHSVKKMALDGRARPRRQIFFKKNSLPSARADTRQNIFFWFFLTNFFCEAFPRYLKLHVQIWDNFDFFCYILLVFFVSLNFMEYFKFELHVHEIIEFGRSKNDIHDIWCMLRPYPGTHMKFRASC